MAISKITSHDISLEKLCVAYSPTYLHEKNLKEEIVRNTPTLRTMSGVYNRDATVAWVVIQMNDLNEFCGKRIKMTVESMTALAHEVIDEYPLMTMTQLLCFISKFKRGHYGEFYGEIDPLRITTAMRKYYDEVREIVHRKKMDDERLQYERDKAESDRRSITYEEYCRQKNLGLI